MLFSRQSEVQKLKFEQKMKIWKSKMAAARSPSTGASISYTKPWSQPFPE